jgi:hypothetical protein
MHAVRVTDLRSPLRRPLREGDRTALTVAGTGKIRTGDLVVFCKPVAVTLLITPGSASSSSSSMR